jgi:Putative Flp pilus-assembly TadE/G-like
MLRLHPLAAEQGAVMVTVALALPVLILFASFVVDIGNWFEHQRHLQLQADAGALAAAGDFRYPCNATDDENVEKSAREYSGTESETGGYNHQVGGTPFGDVHFALNSRTYYGQSKEDPTVVEAPPCEAGMVDVKLTETDLPLFFRVASLFEAVPFINAHARVQIFEKGSVSGALPVAVPDDNPQKARVTFVDEESGAELGSRELTKEKEGEEGLAIWDNEAEPLPLTVGEANQRIGVRVALSGGSSTTCGDPLVQCYDAGSSGGILFARGFSMAGSGVQPGPPLARNVYLSPDGCSDPYFSTGGCSAFLHAEVDFGPCEELGEVGAHLTAVLGGSKYTLEPESEGSCPLGTSTSKWVASIPIPTEGGPVPIELEWSETKGKEAGHECTSKGGNKCKGTFGEVQRSFVAANALSGPIHLARVEEGGSWWANSFERCSAVQTECTYPVAVKIGIKENQLENAKNAESPPVALRVFHEAENNPSQNQALDCDPALPNLREEIAHGCKPEYTRNQGTACPSQKTVLWASPQPWECTAIKTGGAVNQVYQGMSKRVFGTEEPKKGECVHPNEWSKFPNLDYGNDPRIVPVFLTPFGSFSGSGSSETVPVTNFATFYVTGWAGQGGGNTSFSICDGTAGEPPDEEAESGEILGHFIKYVDALNEGEASEAKCEFNSLTPCVAVLTE